MKRWLKVALNIMVIALITIQFFPAQTNTGKTVEEMDFIRLTEPPDRIGKKILAACYDCHSNSTEYPWYSNVQPFGWLLQYHIDLGKKELNFSEYGDYSDRRKHMKLNSSVSQIEDDKMPLLSYRLMHSEARLSEQEKKELVNYLTMLKDKLE